MKNLPPDPDPASNIIYRPPPIGHNGGPTLDEPAADPEREDHES